MVRSKEQKILSYSQMAKEIDKNIRRTRSILLIVSIISIVIPFLSEASRV